MSLTLCSAYCMVIYVTVCGSGRCTTSVFGRTQWLSLFGRGGLELANKVYLHSTLQEIVCNKE